MYNTVKIDVNIHHIIHLKNFLSITYIQQNYNESMILVAWKDIGFGNRLIFCTLNPSHSPQYS